MQYKKDFSRQEVVNFVFYMIELLAHERELLVEDMKNSIKLTGDWSKKDKSRVAHIEKLIEASKPIIERFFDDYKGNKFRLKKYLNIRSSLDKLVGNKDFEDVLKSYDSLATLKEDYSRIKQI